MTASRGVTRRGVLSVAAVGALSGCGLGADPTVRPGLPIEAPRGEGPIRIPNGPGADASPQEIVQGFMRAGVTTIEGLSVAREYLTTARAKAWNPDSQTIIFAGDMPEVDRLGGTGHTYRITVNVVALIDTESRYQTYPPNKNQTFDFRLEQVDGQWRIDDLDAALGRVIQQGDVTAIFEDYPVHYPAIGWNELVVDQRWFPRDQTATRLGRAQLGRVPDYLKGAVSSASRAELAVDSVPVSSDGVAKVDLKAETVSEDQRTRKQLAAQLVATIMAVPGVNEVEITLDGNPMDLGIEDALTSPEQFGFVSESATRTPTVLARQDKKLVEVGARLSSVTARELRRAKSIFAPMDASWQLLGAHPDGKEVAAVDGKRRKLARWLEGGAFIPVPPFAAAMTRPCYDFGGVLWVGGTGLGTEEGYRLWAINTTADPGDTTNSAPQHVPVPWIDVSHRVRAAMVSPDRARIAMITYREGHPEDGARLDVSGVERLANGLPEKISDDRFQLAADLVEMIDVAWVGPSTLAVIGRRDGQSQLQPYLVGVGGTVTSMNPRPGMAQVTTTGDAQDMVLMSEGGRVFQRAAGLWDELPLLDGIVSTGA